MMEVQGNFRLVCEGSGWRFMADAELQGNFRRDRESFGCRAVA